MKSLVVAATAAVLLSGIGLGTAAQAASYHLATASPAPSVPPSPAIRRASTP